MFGPTLAHWDGTRWSTGSAVLSSTVSLRGLDFAGPADGWAVGDYYDSSTYTDTPVLLHYDGTAWAALAAPGDLTRLFSVSAVSPGDAWFAGYGTAGGTIYHYDHGIWTPSPLPAGVYPSGPLFMLNDNEGWFTTYVGNGNYSIFHWNGANWTAEYTGAGIFSIAGVSGRVWAVGGADTILSRTGSSWTTVQGGPTTNTLNGVAALSTDEAWAVGDYGTMLHYTGRAWHAVPLSTTASLYGIQMLSPTEGFAVGAGTVLQYSAGSWSAMAAQQVPVLYGLAMLSTSEGWAVGRQGAITHLQNGSWTAAASPTSQDLYAVAFDSPTHGWAVGGMRTANAPGVLLEYDGTTWTDQSALLPAGVQTLRSILLTSGGGWATIESYSTSSPHPAILRLSGRTWSYANVPNPSYAYQYQPGLTAEALGEAWSIGCDFYHEVGGVWSRVDVPFEYCQSAVSLVPGRGGWAVGAYGEILQYNPLAPGQRYYDVPLSNPFASYIEYMAAHNIISGYADNTFHPYANITRGQLTKMVVNGMGWAITTPATPTFADVPASHPFYSVRGDGVRARGDQRVHVRGAGGAVPGAVLPAGERRDAGATGEDHRGGEGMGAGEPGDGDVRGRAGGAPVLRLRGASLCEGDHQRVHVRGAGGAVSGAVFPAGELGDAGATEQDLVPGVDAALAAARRAEARVRRAPRVGSRRPRKTQWHHAGCCEEGRSHGRTVPPARFADQGRPGRRHNDARRQAGAPACHTGRSEIACGQDLPVQR